MWLPEEATTHAAFQAPLFEGFTKGMVIINGTENNWICQIPGPGGQKQPLLPVGPALGQYGVNIGQFTKEFNERTKNDMGMMIPVVITVYADRSFTFITKTPPASLLIKKACGIESGSGVPNKNKVANYQPREICLAEQKMPDLNCTDIEAAMRMIAGTCRSMGVVVAD